MAAAALLIATGGCREGVDVTVSQSAAGVSFTATPADADFTACVQRAYLYDESGAAPRQLWYATRGLARDPCIREVRYAPNPRGFSAAAGPTLKSGARYRVELIGSGFTAAASFVRK